MMVLVIDIPCIAGFDNRDDVHAIAAQLDVY